VAALGEQVTATTVSLTPDASMLASPATVYPLYIDPKVYGGNQNGRAMVDRSYPRTAYYNWSGKDQGLGFQDFAGVDTKRLFFQFPTAAVAGRHILSATLSDTERWSSGCSARPVQAWLTGAIHPTTTWNAQPAWLRGGPADTRTVAYGNPSCRASSSVSPNDTLVEWNVTSSMVFAASIRTSTTTFGLRAGDESDHLGWKRFAPAATLSIRYNTAPNPPTSLTGPGGACASSAAAPSVGAGPATFAATLTDADGDLLTGYVRYVSPSGAVTTLSTGHHLPGVFIAATPAALAAPGRWWYSVSSSDLVDSSATTGPCYFVVDPAAPHAPVVKLNGTAQAVDPVTGAPVPRAVALGAALAFTFGPNPASPDTVRYRWALNGDAPGAELLGTVAGGTVSRTVSVAASGPTTLRVWAYDAAGNQSSPAAFELTAAGFGPTRWGFDDSSAPQAAFDPTCATSITGTGAALRRPVLSPGPRGCPGAPE
jgi:hypothetical protein